MSVRIIQDTRGAGLDALARRLQQLGKNVLVGVPEGKTEPDGTSMAEVAAVNEFGSGDGRIPERSFMRTGISEHIDRLRDNAARNTKAVANGRIDANTALDRLGISAAGAIKQKIVEGPFAPNAPSTIQQKGSDKPLIDSASLRQTITHVIEGATS